MIFFLGTEMTRCGNNVSEQKFHIWTQTRPLIKCQSSQIRKKLLKFDGFNGKCHVIMYVIMLTRQTNNEMVIRLRGVVLRPPSWGSAPAKKRKLRRREIASCWVGRSEEGERLGKWLSSYTTTRRGVLQVHIDISNSLLSPHRIAY